METLGLRLPFGSARYKSAQPKFSIKTSRVPWIAMARQFVYFMQGLSKTYPEPPGARYRHLSFYPDANNRRCSASTPLQNRRLLAKSWPPRQGI